ncbi:MAG TPA: site-specific DNA-methyltransferase [Anaerolineales bacterium]|nr:site-specific DNA-methyltransferase [Anaerolineales bacterium]
MPELKWPTKAPPTPIPASLRTDSIIYPRGAGYPDMLASNRLILGDNLAVMWALLPEYEGRIDLIYADPPFFSNRRYPLRVGRGEDSRRPSEWRLAEGYPDHWPDLESYLDMLYPRLRLMHRLLAPTGSLYLHLDWHANAYARLLLDEIFGPERLLNEIVWVYHGPSPIRRAFNRKHDTILAYTRGSEYTFNVDAVRTPYDPSTVKTFESSPKAGFGKVPDLQRGKVPEDWWYFPVVARMHSERTGYPTQKPEALVERIILASSNPGDLVADFFCGSGTTPVVAERNGRRFLAADVAWQAVHTSRTRLLSSAEQPFNIQEALQDPARPAGAIDPFPVDPGMLRFDVQTRQVHLEPEAIPDLDYWEADPSWNGSVFRSVAQAARPRRKANLPRTLSLPQADGRQPIGVRLWGVRGERYQASL